MHAGLTQHAACCLAPPLPNAGACAHSALPRVLALSLPRRPRPPTRLSQMPCLLWRAGAPKARARATAALAPPRLARAAAALLARRASSLHRSPAAPAHPPGSPKCPAFCGTPLLPCPLLPTTIYEPKHSCPTQQPAIWGTRRSAGSMSCLCLMRAVQPEPATHPILFRLTTLPSNNTAPTQPQNAAAAAARAQPVARQRRRGAGQAERRVSLECAARRPHRRQLPVHAGAAGGRAGRRQGRRDAAAGVVLRR